MVLCGLTRGYHGKFINFAWDLDGVGLLFFLIFFWGISWGDNANKMGTQATKMMSLQDIMGDNEEIYKWI